MKKLLNYYGYLHSYDESKFTLLLPIKYSGRYDMKRIKAKGAMVVIYELTLQIFLYISHIAVTEEL